MPRKKKTSGDAESGVAIEALPELQAEVVPEELEENINETLARTEIVNQITDTPARRLALDAMLTAAMSKLGKGAVMRAGSNESLNIECLSMQHPLIDGMLGRGLPFGRVVEIYGPESSGKTTLALHAIAMAQMTGGRAAFIDVEHALDPEYAKALGVNMDDLLISQPDDGESALELCDMMVKTAAIDVIVVDSVAALVTKAELEGEMGDQHVGRQARLMSQALKKITASISRSNCVVIFINQLREKVGVMFGNPEVTSGGRALKFYASVRIDVRKTEQIKATGRDLVVGHKMKLKTVKNKVFPPFRTCEIELRYPQTNKDGKYISAGGFDIAGAILDLAISKKVIVQNGSWFSYKDKNMAQGREAARQALLDNTDLFNEIKSQVL